MCNTRWVAPRPTTHSTTKQTRTSRATAARGRGWRCVAERQRGGKGAPRRARWPQTLHAMASSVTIKDVIDVDKNGKVSKSEFAHALDENKDGKVTKHEAVDLDRDGKVEKKEKDLMDSNNDAKITRHEVLAAPDADSNHDGKVTPKEKHAVLLSPPPATGAASSAAARLATTKAYVMGARVLGCMEDMIDEFVLLAVFFVTLHALYKGQKKPRGRASTKRSPRSGSRRWIRMALTRG